MYKEREERISTGPWEAPDEEGMKTRHWQETEKEPLEKQEENSRL